MACGSECSFVKLIEYSGCILLLEPGFISSHLFSYFIIDFLGNVIDIVPDSVAKFTFGYTLPFGVGIGRGRLTIGTGNHAAYSTDLGPPCGGYSTKNLDGGSAISKIKSKIIFIRTTKDFVIFFIRRCSSKVPHSQSVVTTTAVHIVIFYDLCVFFDFNNLGNLFAINVTVLVAVVSFNGLGGLYGRRFRGGRGLYGRCCRRRNGA